MDPVLGLVEVVLVAAVVVVVVIDLAVPDLVADPLLRLNSRLNHRGYVIIMEINYY